jgi:hypothetical protein
MVTELSVETRVTREDEQADCSFSGNTMNVCDQPAGDTLTSKARVNNHHPDQTARAHTLTDVNRSWRKERVTNHPPAHDGDT